MFIKLLNFSDLVFSSEGEFVSFVSESEGLLSIYNNHEDMIFKVLPSKIIVYANNVTSVFFCGFGFASMKHNEFKVVGFPLSETEERFNYTCTSLDQYGKTCGENFVKFD